MFVRLSRPFRPTRCKCQNLEEKVNKAIKERRKINTRPSDKHEQSKEMDHKKNGRN